MAQSNMETDSILSCAICLDFPKDAVICRHCSQPFCSSCIDSQFAQNASGNGLSTCPCCRKEVQRNEFIKLRWTENLLKLITDKNNQSENAKINKCSEHAREELCNYCSTCSKSICAQCILSEFNGKHIDHDYSPIDAAQKRLLKAFDDHENLRQSNLEKLGRCIEDKKSIIAQILLRKQRCYDELKQFETRIKTEIDLETTKILKKFEDEQKALEDEKSDYETKNVKMKKMIESYDQTDLFVFEKDLLEQISRRPNIPKINKIHISDETIRSSLTLPWQTFEFTVEQFSVKQRNNERILTPQFRLDYYQYWSLTIYPNGYGFQKGVYVSVILQLNKGMPQTIDYNVSIKLIHQHHDDNDHNHVLETILPFRERQDHPFSGFYQLKDLFINGFINGNEDSIKLRVELRPKSILEERKLLQWQIQSLNKNKQNRNAEMTRIKTELTRLRQDYSETNRIVKDQRNKIEQLEKDNFKLKQKRSTSNHDHHEDHRSNSNQTKTTIYHSDKRFKK